MATPPQASDGGTVSKLLSPLKRGPMSCHPMDTCRKPARTRHDRVRYYYGQNTLELTPPKQCKVENLVNRSIASESTAVQAAAAMTHQVMTAKTSLNIKRSLASDGTPTKFTRKKRGPPPITSVVGCKDPKLKRPQGPRYTAWSVYDNMKRMFAPRASGSGHTWLSIPSPRDPNEVIIMGARRAHDENVVSGDGDHDHVEYPTLRRWARSSLAYPSHLDRCPYGPGTRRGRVVGNGEERERGYQYRVVIVVVVVWRLDDSSRALPTSMYRTRKRKRVEPLKGQREREFDIPHRCGPLSNIGISDRLVIVRERLDRAYTTLHARAPRSTTFEGQTDPVFQRLVIILLEHKKKVFLQHVSNPMSCPPARRRRKRKKKNTGR
ncbi:hypothetical protein HD554DRAFT_2040004 [Boletus coccyginus]|nr:hypothetical protein HD554DRAFT_2040004 [Boletus coccyginus]